MTNENKVNQTEDNVTTLADMKSGSQGIIVKVNGHGGFRHRIMEMGFVRGEKVSVVKNAPLQDPIEYRIMDSHISLRRNEAHHIEIVQVDEVFDNSRYNSTETFSEEIQKTITEKTNTITVALVGNPNCGKTSLFNHATGLRERVGNYSGVTVSSKIGTFYHNGYTINMVDLPGTYSMTEYSPEELYVRDYLTEHHPDVVLNVVDSTNLERNLFLTTQLIDMNLRLVMALNMFDEFERSGSSLDCTQLENMLGFPCVPTDARAGKGIDHVLQHIITVYNESEVVTKHIHINYGAELEQAISKIKAQIVGHQQIAVDFPYRYIAIKLLENDSVTTNYINQAIDNSTQLMNEVKRQREFIEAEFAEDASSVIANSKYGFIRGALKETLTKTEINDEKKELAYAVDVVLTNRWLGFPVLILFMWIMFQATFTIGEYPMNWIEAGVAWLGSFVGQLLGDGMLRDLVVDGIIAGVGGVIVFLPNILILFFFLSLFEDTGYMARAAFIMDKIMHRMGLHGKSFIPLISGFGCGVPGIMATRTLENPKDRIITMISVPFMSCSARLPVYLLFVSAFFNSNRGLVLMSIYLIGIVMAALTAMLLNRTKFKGKSEQFVMELPPYRIPTLRNTLIHMWEKSVHYLQKMGTVILLASIIIWMLNYFPRSSEKIEAINSQIEFVQNASTYTTEQKAQTIDSLQLAKASAQTENSYIGRIGHAIAPLVKPLGFGWEMGVSLLTGAAAKEIVVSSMGILYQADSNADEESEALKNAIINHKAGTDTYPITPLVAYGFMIFILLYFPCIAATSAIAKEANWWWALFVVVYSTAVAWIFSFAIYQIGSLFV